MQSGRTGHARQLHRWASTCLNPDARTADAADGDSSSGFLLLALAAARYFLPTIIATNRKVNAAGALFFINLIFGWTVLGWIVCIIWAASGATKAQDAFYSQAEARGRKDGIDLDREAYARERARLDHEAEQQTKAAGSRGRVGPPRIG